MATVRPHPRLRVIPGGLNETRRSAAAVYGGEGGSSWREAASDRDGGSSWWRTADGLLAGYGLAAVVTMVAVAVGGTRHPGIAAAGLALAMFVAARRMSLPAAIASGGIGWLFYDGFIVGRHGDLVWGHGAGAAWWLLVLVAAAGCGSALAHARHHG